MPVSLVLASASPRRSQVLRDLGLTFEIRPSASPEPAPTAADGADPAAFVERLAEFKSRDAVPEIQDGEIVVAADTIVVLDDEILGKPKSEAEARAMLGRLRGRTHRVFTGICVRRGDEQRLEHEVTQVTFGNFSDEFIAAYVATGEPMDKAGAYAAQGRGALLTARIEGDYWNVVGLPIFRLAPILAEFGFHVTDFWRKTANSA